MNSTTSLPSAPASLPLRPLGAHGPRVSTIGLGCMGMSDFYGPIDPERNVRTLNHALESGINFLDTADAYGPFTNEELVGCAIRGRRDPLVVATKCGIVRDPANPGARGVDNRPAYIRACCEASLKRLGIETIDVYYLHRHDPESASIEDAVGAMAELVKAGKVRHLGLSEVSAATLAKAHRVHPITALQSEYSLWSRDPETDGTLQFCRENGIAFVPYSPIGRGFLTGAIKRYEDFPADDVRRNMPRFQGENFAKNLEIVRTLELLAARRSVKPAQLALAWVLAQGTHIVPIPGTTRIEHLDELIAATRIQLSDTEIKEISDAFPLHRATGDRYYANMHKYIGR